MTSTFNVVPTCGLTMFHVDKVQVKNINHKTFQTSNIGINFQSKATGILYIRIEY